MRSSPRIGPQSTTAAASLQTVFASESAASPLPLFFRTFFDLPAPAIRAEQLDVFSPLTYSESSMRASRLIFASLLALALSVYAFDCLAMFPSQDSMQCCDSMPCASHGTSHSDGCCKTMTAAHASFIQPHSSPKISLLLVFAGVLFPANQSQPEAPSAFWSSAESHGPPFPPLLASSPLRL